MGEDLGSGVVGSRWGERGSLRMWNGRFVLERRRGVLWSFGRRQRSFVLWQWSVVLRVLLGERSFTPGSHAGGEGVEESHGNVNRVGVAYVRAAEGEGDDGEHVRVGEGTLFLAADGVGEAEEVGGEVLLGGEGGGEAGEVFQVPGVDVVELEEALEVVDVPAAGGGDAVGSGASRGGCHRRASSALSDDFPVIFVARRGAWTSLEWVKGSRSGYLTM